MAEGIDYTEIARRSEAAGRQLGRELMRGNSYSMRDAIEGFVDAQMGSDPVYSNGKPADAVAEVEKRFSTAARESLPPETPDSLRDLCESHVLEGLAAALTKPEDD